MQSTVQPSCHRKKMSKEQQLGESNASINKPQLIKRPPVCVTSPSRSVAPPCYVSSLSDRWPSRRGALWPSLTFTNTREAFSYTRSHLRCHKYNWTTQCLSRVSWCIIEKTEASAQPLLCSFFSLSAFVPTPFTPLIHPHPPLFIYLKGQAPVIVQNKQKKCENGVQLTVSLIFRHLLTTFFLRPCCLTP